MESNNIVTLDNCTIRYNENKEGSLLSIKNDITEFIVPNDVIIIEDNCFINCNNLEKLIISESVLTINNAWSYNFNNSSTLNHTKLKTLNILNPNCNIKTLFSGTRYNNIYWKFIKQNMFSNPLNNAIHNSSYSITNQVSAVTNTDMVNIEFIKFLNLINESIDNIFKYVNDDFLTLEDIMFLLDDTYKGFISGHKYGI